MFRMIVVSALPNIKVVVIVRRSALQHLTLPRTSIKVCLEFEHPALYGKGPHPLLWSGSRPAGGKIALSCIPNRLNNSVVLMVYRYYIA